MSQRLVLEVLPFFTEIIAANLSSLYDKWNLEKTLS